MLLMSTFHLQGKSQPFPLSWQKQKGSGYKLYEVLLKQTWVVTFTIEALIQAALLIFRGKKAKFHGIFRGKFAEKLAVFAGKKSKFVEKSADFARFQRKKVKFRRIFRILRKIGRFHGRFRGETSPRNNQSKTADFAGFFLANFTKIDQFCVDMTSIV